MLYQLVKKVIHEIILHKNNKYKKLYVKSQNAIKSFDILYRKSLQDNVIDKTEYESLFKFSTKYVDETKMNLFYKYDYNK